jgi:hypothetical protein
VTGSVSRPGRGRPTNPWSAIKREVRGHDSQNDVHLRHHTPHLQTLRPEGALERREAPSLPPPSTPIACHRCHRPEICRRVRTNPVTEPQSPLPPLRQPRSMTWPSTMFPPPAPMVYTLLTLSVFSSVVLVVVDLEYHKFCL